MLPSCSSALLFESATGSRRYTPRRAFRRSLCLRRAFAPQVLAGFDFVSPRCGGSRAALCGDR
jgi:hypothetical protein